MGWSSGRSTSLPASKRAPARTRATRWGALTTRQRAWAASMSLNAIASPAAFEPGPLVTLVRCRTVAKVDSIVILSAQNDHVCELLVCVADGVGDVAGQHGRVALETRGVGVSRWGLRAVMARRSPRASARAWRRRLLSVSSSRWSVPDFIDTDLGCQVG